MNESLTEHKSASSNAGIQTNIHVLPSWMMAKAMPHMDVRSLPLRREYWFEFRITVDVAAPRESRGRPASASLWVLSPPRQYNDDISINLKVFIKNKENNRVNSIYICSSL